MSKICISILGFILLLNPVFAQIEKINVNEGDNSGKLNEIIVVFKMHFDIGYTDLAESVLHKYTTSMIDETLSSLKATSNLPKSEQFVWTIPGWPMKYILENSTPARKDGMEKALKDGRFRLHALPFTIETESSDLENLVRNLEYSTQINKKFGMSLPSDAKMTDVPSHSWILPTLLTHAGVKILHIGCNAGSTSPDVPTLFWWEGPDGSRLLTFNWAEYYGSGLMPPKNWKYSTWLALIHTHENTGAPQPNEVAALLVEAKKKFPGTKVRIGQLSDFYDALMKDNPDIPVIKGDMPDTWIHGFMSMPREVKNNKRLQRTVYHMQNLNTLNNIWKNRREDITPFIDKCTEDMSLFDEHTFGMSMSHGAGAAYTYDDDFIINRARGYYDRIETSWKEKASRIDDAERIEKMIFKEEIQSLAASVNLKGNRVVVYNPHPWSRSGEVSLFMNIYDKKNNVTALKDTVNNKIIKVYNKDNLLRFYVENVPAMGYRAYIPIFDGQQIIDDDGITIDEKNNTLTNKFFILKIDPDRGILLSCIDKRKGRELVDAKSKYGFGEYIHERYGANDMKRYCDSYVKPGQHGWADKEMVRPVLDCDYEMSRPSKGRLTYSKNGDEVTVTYFGEMPSEYSHKYSFTYILNANLPYVELIWNVENKQADPHPEAGWIAFPFNVDKPQFHLGRIGAVVNPIRDFIPRTNHDYFFLNTGLAITDKSGRGVGLNSPDAPAVSLDHPGLFNFSGTLEPQLPEVFVNLYNNQWGTNFTEWIDGSWSAKMYIWSVEGYTNETGLISPTEETRQPLVGCYFNGLAGSLSLEGEGVSLSKKGILITSFTRCKNSNGYCLRLWEQTGESGICEVKLPLTSVKEAIACNLRGEPLSGVKPIQLKNGKFEIEYKAYQPITLMLR